MPICAHCGVELAADAKTCPLCGKPLEMHHEPSHFPESFIDPEDREKLTARERRTIVWEAVSVSLGIAALTVILINVLLDRRVTWSLYPLFSLMLVWSIVTPPVLLPAKPLFSLLVPAIALPLFLFGVDLVDGSLTWAIPGAIPIAAAAEISALVAGILGYFSRHKGLNLVALALLAVATTCIGIEATIDHLATGAVLLSWSAIVAVTLVPIAAFLFYLHYRIGKKASLRKLFKL